MELHNQSEFYVHATRFLKKVCEQLDQLDISYYDWPIDHICYRVETKERYLQCKFDLAKWAALLIESEVAGRPIATFKLSHPIFFAGRFIDLIELPAPKEGKRKVEGFEHIEFVVDRNFLNIREENKCHDFDLSGLTKNYNQELKLKLKDGGFQVKFHYQSLESVINLEKNKIVSSALKKSDVLGKLRHLSPLIAGTYPLNLFLSNSDLDIIVSHKKMHELRDEIRFHYAVKEKFKDTIVLVRGEESYVANFVECGVEIEIFGQNICPVDQYAFRHYQIEERLLKIGSERFQLKIMEYRKKKIKTEPAFAKALGLVGDPFMELLELGNLSESELYRKLETVNGGFV